MLFLCADLHKPVVCLHMFLDYWNPNWSTQINWGFSCLGFIFCEGVVLISVFVVFSSFCMSWFLFLICIYGVWVLFYLAFLFWYQVKLVYLPKKGAISSRTTKIRVRFLNSHQFTTFVLGIPYLQSLCSVMVRFFMKGYSSTKRVVLLRSSMKSFIFYLDFFFNMNEECEL